MKKLRGLPKLNKVLSKVLLHGLGSDIVYKYIVKD